MSELLCLGHPSLFEYTVLTGCFICFASVLLIYFASYCMSLPAGLINLMPELTDDLLQRIDQPLKVAVDPSNGRRYVLCDYNRDGDSYRYGGFVKVAVYLRMYIVMCSGIQFVAFDPSKGRCYVLCDYNRN